MMRNHGAELSSTTNGFPCRWKHKDMQLKDIGFVL